jgi:TP901 family phage tail tape measure protein
MQDQKLRFQITGDATKLTKALNTASGKLQSFGSKVSALGRDLSTKLTLPLALAGGAALKMGLDFDKSMTKIKTLVGIASDEVDQMGKVAIEMAKNTGVSAKDAADALFFITSAGLRGADAMAVLEQSLKASAIGLGDTKTVADLATSALNAYGVENLSASQATDVLTAAIREGKLEADSLSQSMGTVLPVASQLGVKFSEVGATFAAMSRTGTDASMAATQIRGVLFALLKPTKQAKDTLKQFNLSAEGLRDQLGKEGLLSTLKTLTNAFGDNEEAQGKVFANTRALSGVLDLMGKNLGSTEEIFDRMNTTAGITAEAFAELEKSASFKLEKSLNDLKVAFTEIGSVLLETFTPVIQEISSVLVSLSQKFQSLDPGVKKAIVIFTALVAALGPFLMILGAMSSGIGILIGVFESLTLASAPFLIAIAAVVAALGVTVAYQSLKNSIESLNEEIPKLKDNLLKAEQAFDGSTTASLKLYDAKRKLLKSELDLLKLQQDKEQGAIAKMLGIESDEYIRLGEEISKTEQKIKNYDLAISGLENQVTSTTEETKDLGKSLEELRGIDLKNLQIKWDLQEEAKQFAQDFDEAIGNELSAMDMTFGDVFNEKVSEAFDPDSVPVMDEFDTAEMDLENILNSDEHKAFLDKMKNMSEISQAVGGEVANAFNQMGMSLVNSLGLADDGFQGFVKGLIGTITQLIAMMLSSAIAQSIAGATASGTATGPAAVVTTPAFIATAIGGVLGAFAAIPKFANGGIVSGPTMGLMGEYPGAKSNPEVIAPLDKLQGMMGGKSQNVNVGGQFKINGQDLVVALQRADRNRSRIK